MTLFLTCTLVACEQQTYYRSSLLSEDVTDVRTCLVGARQSRWFLVISWIPPAVSITCFWRDRDNRRDEGDGIKFAIDQSGKGYNRRGARPAEYTQGWCKNSSFLQLMFIVRLSHSVDIFPVKCFLGNLKFKLEVSFKGIKVQEIKRRTARFKITVKSCCVIVRKKPTVPASYSTGLCWSCSRSHGLLQNWFYLQTCSTLSCNKYKQVVAGST